MTTLALLLALVAAPSLPPPPPRPKLVVVITVDQLRPDYLVRYRPQLTGGLARLLRTGAVFEQAHQDHAITETAVGHAVLLSGRHPARTGIVYNDASVQDSTSVLLEGSGGGASPFRFRGTVLMDWLKVADLRSRGLSVSRKDNAAILPMGRTREHVYWNRRGPMTTSSYYACELPEWVRAFNARHIPERAAGRTWEPLLSPDGYAEPDSQPWEDDGHEPSFPHVLPMETAPAIAAFLKSPWADEYLLAFALEGVRALDLAAGPAPDLLAISLSTTDYIGHTFGPHSREIHDQILRLDLALGAFLDSLYRLRDSGDVLIALTADHGVPPIPEYRRVVEGRRAERIDFQPFARAMERELAARLGPASGGQPWVILEKGLLILRRAELAARGVRVDSLVALWTAEVKRSPWVWRVDTRRTLAAADTARDPIARRWRHLLPPDLAAELMITLKPDAQWAPYWPYSMWSPRTVTDHGSPHDHDSHVPLILYGPGIRPGSYAGRVGVVDLAPTLARLIGVPPLEPVDGRILREALADRR